MIMLMDNGWRNYFIYLDIGGVREPLPSLIESDYPIVKEAAAMIEDARKRFC